MGNRAIITAAPFDKDGVGIYVHWNGGRASIEGFCQAAATLGFRSPDDDDAYGLARLTQLIGTFFGPDGLSVGIGIVSGLDTENGVYVIGTDGEGRGWQIVERRGDAWGDEPFALLTEDDLADEEIDEKKTRDIAERIVAKTFAAAAAELEKKEA